MPDTPTPLPERLADAEGELPEEIAKAIDALVDAEHDQIKKGSRDADAWCEAAGVCHRARAALTATILARLTAAESARDALKAEIRDQAMRQLASDAGWELENDKLRAEREAANFMAESWKATAEAEAEIGSERAAEAKAALARAERAEKALEGLAHDVSAIRFQVAEKAAFGVAPATFGDKAPYSIGWRQACDAIAAEISAALAHPATAEET